MILIGAPLGAIVALVLALLALYIPYFFYQCFMAYKENTQASRDKQNMLNSLLVKTYDPNTFHDTPQECSICMQDFESAPGSKPVTPLPCNRMHVFHTECIKSWLQDKDACPNCRTKITSRDCKQLKKDFNTIYQPKVEN